MKSNLAHGLIVFITGGGLLRLVNVEAPFLIVDVVVVITTG